MDDDTTHIDKILLDESGRLRLVPESEFAKIDRDYLRLWCHKTARYGLPNAELIEWLKRIINGRRALEIGSGNGDLGHLLGIQESDSYVQTTPEVMLQYMVTGQIPTKPPTTVAKLEAIEAIDRYKPEVVVASWVTRKFITGIDREGVAQAFVHGVVEEAILDRGVTYIHIGNLNSHGQKTIRSYPHETYRFPWLRSRAAYPDQNVIQVWPPSKRSD